MHRLFLLTVTACLLAAGPASAMTPDEAFVDGNRLFRDDLYWAALLRYRQAMEAGFDSPALHYNMGVAHYRARQHIRARESLLKAVDYPEFRLAAQYNLGLNAYALGEEEEALRWFRVVRDQDENPTLSRYAAAAIARMQTEDVAEVVAVETRAASLQKPPSFTNFQFRSRIGFGIDNNPFRSPNVSYFDFADPDLPFIQPDVQSGVFIPVSLTAKYQVNAVENEGFFAAYRFGGRFFQDSKLENANEYRQEVSFGSEYNRRADGKLRQVFSAFTIGQSDEVYYDPDDGAPRAVDGVTIEDRLNYTRYGPELTLRQGGERWTFGMELVGQLWDYDDVDDIVPSYDHEFFLVGGMVQRKFSNSSLLRASVNYSVRNFNERPSFDLDGNQFVTNPTLRYDYLDVGLTVRQRIIKGMWVGLDYVRTQRVDQFEGYNDYFRDSFGGEFHWTPHYRFNLEAWGRVRIYSYPNAFAFNNPFAGSKIREDGVLAITASYRMTDSLWLVLEAQRNEVVSNDVRMQYDRDQYSLSVRWEP
jgi:tetratricopeptide (TPR) repeat protein